MTTRIARRSLHRARNGRLRKAGPYKVRRANFVPSRGAACCAPTGKNYDLDGGSFCLGVILARAASMSGGRAVTGALLVAPAPPLLGPPKKRMAVAARP